MPTPVQTKAPTTAHILPCPRRVTVADIAPLAAELRSALVPQGAVVLDAAALQEGDLSLMQLLLSARRRAEALSCAFRIDHAPDSPLARLAERCGVTLS